METDLSNNSPTITAFRGEYYFLSNFYLHTLDYDGLVYPSSENAYQASKTYPEYRYKFINLSPGEAKYLGRRIAVREDFDRISSMYAILQVKFSDPVLLSKLIDTAPAILQEGNSWGDSYWGVCAGVGDNHLGNLLMKIRDSHV